MSVIAYKDFKDLSPLSIDLTNIEEVYNIDIDSVHDIYFGLKATIDATDELVFLKTLLVDPENLQEYPGGITRVNKIIIIPFLEADWDTIVAETEYFLCLGIKREETGWFEEVRFTLNDKADQQAKIKIEADKIRR